MSYGRVQKVDLAEPRGDGTAALVAALGTPALDNAIVCATFTPYLGT